MTTIEIVELVKVGYLMIFWFLMYSIWNSLHDIRKSTKNSESILKEINASLSVITDYRVQTLQEMASFRKAQLAQQEREIGFRKDSQGKVML